MRWLSMTGKRWLKTQEAADYLSIHRVTLYRYMKEGKVTAKRMGAHWRIDKDELDGLFNSCLDQEDRAKDF